MYKKEWVCYLARRGWPGWPSRTNKRSSPRTFLAISAESGRDRKSNLYHCLWQWGTVSILMTGSTEVEYLDINLTKARVVCSMLFTHSPFYWRILKKTTLFSGFTNPYKKSAKQENSDLFKNSILLYGKIIVENQTKTRVWEDPSLCLETSTKKYHLWIPYLDSQEKEVQTWVRIGLVISYPQME